MVKKKPGGNGGDYKDIRTGQAWRFCPASAGRSSGRPPEYRAPCRAPCDAQIPAAPPHPDPNLRSAAATRAPKPNQRDLPQLQPR